MKMFKKDPNRLDTNHLILYVEDGVVRAKCYDKKGREGIVDTEELLDSIDVLKDEKIYGISFSEGYTNFKIGALKVSIENNDKLKNDKRLSFVNKSIKNKRYKLQRRRKLIKPILTSAFALTLASVLTLNASFLAKERKLKEEDSIVPTTYSYVDDNLGDFAKNTNDNVVNMKKDILNNMLVTSNEETKTNEEETSQKLEEETTLEVEEPETKETEVKEELSATKVTPKKVDKNSPTYKVYLNKRLASLCGSKKDCGVPDKVRNNYGNIIQKYCNIYQVDPEIMIAIASQESGGNHRSTKDAGGGVGLMQIQASAVKKVTAYNHETGKIDVINVTEEKLGNVDFNIRVATMIFQTKMKQMNGNICLALQSYNMGEGTMAKVLKNYSYTSGRNVEEIINDPSDLGWTDNLKGYPGDPGYLPHTLRYYNGTPETLNIENDVQEVQAKTR